MLKNTMIKTISNSKNNTIKLSLLTCLWLAVSACQTPGVLVSAEPAQYPEYITRGDILPINTITTIDGVEMNLHRSDKKKLVVLFATWCSDSNRLITALNNSPLLKDENIDIIAIAREEDTATVKAWRDKRGIKVALAVDEDRSIYKKFAAGGIPRIISVDEDNVVIKMNLAEGQEQLSNIIWQ
ncbi:TlpA family protein disulfide reductase [Colwellia psychrerythraea]|uniref:Redoxin domain protein n=1 Tax=Colwellia psychrerythraea TaxID=28229 RepID=A0A099KJU1_COLPS|nr:redoxin family protein [Colwellia psychrerythraea]KGJ89873.1 Redoxin domain protein [Colwellia psychrerythraea]